MTLFVVDASVAVKWFVSERHSPQALELWQGSANTLIAPDWILAEAGQTFAKKVRNREMNEWDVPENFSGMRDALTFFPAANLAEAAFVIAMAHNRSVYDSLYVALALQEGCQLVTADEKLVNALRGAFSDTLLWLGDVPA